MLALPLSIAAFAKAQQAPVNWQRITGLELLLHLDFKRVVLILGFPIGSREVKDIEEGAPVKAAVIALVKSAESVDVDALLAIASKGLNIPADLKTIADVQTFFTLFKNSFLPVVEEAYSELKADAQS